MRIRNKEKQRIWSIEFYRRNRGKINELRRYKTRNDEKYREQGKERGRRFRARNGVYLSIAENFVFEKLIKIKPAQSAKERRRKRYKEDGAYRDREIQRIKKYSIMKAMMRCGDALSDFIWDKWEDMKKINDFRCIMCGKKEPEIKLSIDHIIPLSKRGTNDMANIQPLCRSCNSRKNNKVITN